MPSILEALKERLAEATKNYNEATVKFQLAQAAHQQAGMELNIWRGAVEAEARAEQARVEAAKAAQPTLAGIEPQSTSTGVNEANVDEASLRATSSDATVSTNKTEMVRTLLRQNPAGLTAPQIWQHVTSEFKHRPYMYSVLKRLKDRDEVTFRRNKYFLRHDEEVQPSLIVQ